MLLIVWHSRTGAARAMARAAWTGARGAGETRRISARTADPAAMLAATGYLFCCPENLGGLTGTMKEFFDRCYYPLLGQIEGRPYATLIAAGSDGTGAQRQLDRIVTGWRLRRVAEPAIVSLAAQTPEAILAAKTVPEAALRECFALGAALSEGLAHGIF
ncbi:MAG: NAD(P)H-dependent oxidoreductase [Novosphingobium sp.]